MKQRDGHSAPSTDVAGGARSDTPLKHSPKPWIAECVGSSGSYDNPTDVYEVNNGYRRIAEYLTEADARLIAAAPELLEALQALDAAFQGTDPDRIQDSDPDTANALRKARVAIARATAKG